MKQRQAGFSLIELAIVLGVVGVVMGGIWVVVGKVQQMARVKQTVEQVITLKKNVRDYYQSRACIPGDGVQTAALIGATPPVFPREMLDTVAGAAFDAWNGNVTVESSVIAVGACTFLYTLTFTTLPPDICAQLVPQLTAAGEAARGLTSAAINGVALTALPPNPTAIIGNANGQCGQNATARVALTYKLRMAE